MFFFLSDAIDYFAINEGQLFMNFSNCNYVISLFCVSSSFSSSLGETIAEVIH